MQPPEQFNKEVYEEVRQIINTSQHSGIETELLLAQAAGGSILRAAIYPLECPPCSSENNCSECWANEWCVHKNTPPDVRVKLISALSVFTTPDIKIPEKILAKVKSYDKTNPIRIGYILEVARILYAKWEKKNDSPKDP
jgi:hypothetical protein